MPYLYKLKTFYVKWLDTVVCYYFSKLIPYCHKVSLSKAVAVCV